MSARVRYVLLYRGKTEWRTTVAAAGEVACGALPSTTMSESFDLAAQEFTDHLREYWDVEAPIDWQQIRPDWWGADLLPGALAAAGEAMP